MRFRPADIPPTPIPDQPDDDEPAPPLDPRYPWGPAVGRWLLSR